MHLKMRLLSITKTTRPLRNNPLSAIRRRWAVLLRPILGPIGVSSIVGTVLMCAMVTAGFSVVYINAIDTTNNFIDQAGGVYADISLFIQNDKVILKHNGGESLKEYQLIINGEKHIGQNFHFGDSISFSYSNGGNIVLTSDSQTVLFYNGIVKNVLEEPYVLSGVFFNVYPSNGSIIPANWDYLNVSWLYNDPNNASNVFTVFYKVNNTNWTTAAAGHLKYCGIYLNNISYGSLLEWYIVADNGVYITNSPVFWVYRQ